MENSKSKKLKNQQRMLFKLILLIVSENTLNKSDYAKLKKKINSVFKKKTKKKSKKILKLISTIKKFNNGKLIPENINLNTVIVTRQDSPTFIFIWF